MSSRYKKTPFCAWETAKSSGFEERFIRMGNSQLLHSSVLDLNAAAFRVYTYMKLEAGGKREFEYPRAKFIKIISRNGFQKALTELVRAGLIEVVEHNANLRKPNIYRFSEKWKEGKSCKLEDHSQ